MVQTIKNIIKKDISIQTFKSGIGYIQERFDRKYYLWHYSKINEELINSKYGLKCNLSVQEYLIFDVGNLLNGFPTKVEKYGNPVNGDFLINGEIVGFSQNKNIHQGYYSVSCEDCLCIL